MTNPYATLSEFPGKSISLGLDRIVTADLNSSGAGESRILNVNSAALWVVRQISLLTVPTASGAQCKLTYGIGIVDTSYFCGTGDTAEGYPIYLKSGESILLTWSNGPASGKGQCQFWFDEVMQ